MIFDFPPFSFVIYIKFSITYRQKWKSQILSYALQRISRCEKFSKVMCRWLIHIFNFLLFWIFLHTYHIKIQILFIYIIAILFWDFEWTSILRGWYKFKMEEWKRTFIVSIHKEAYLHPHFSWIWFIFYSLNIKRCFILVYSLFYFRFNK